MGRVRDFEERDIPRVTALHRRVFPLPGGGKTDRLEDYHVYFRETFLSNPWADGQSSLVYEDGDGQLIGFLGVMTRQMKLYAQPMRLVTSSQCMVDPARRSTLAGIELLRALLAGPQDLTLADEASDVSRTLWEKLGGTTELLCSLYWARLLRPAEFAVLHWRKDGRKTASGLWAFLCRLADAAVARWPAAPLRPPGQSTRGEDLDGDTLAACISSLGEQRALRPVCTGQEAAWLLEFLSRKPGCGALHKVLVRTPAGEVAGWYLYCGRPGAVGEVLQIGARDECAGDVLDHLFADAWRSGAVALIGRVDPRWIPALSARNCFFHHRGHWTLVHARNPQVLQAIHRGDAFLTRLEGEWCMRFQVEYA